MVYNNFKIYDFDEASSFSLCLSSVAVETQEK